MIQVLSDVVTVSLGQCFPRLLRNVVPPYSWVIEAQEKFCSLPLDLLVVVIIIFTYTSFVRKVLRLSL
jgi:hypothetical protein